MHITQTPFSKLNFLIGFFTGFLTNVTECNFYISFKIVTAWFSKVLTLCRTVHLKVNFSWLQVSYDRLPFWKIKSQDLKTNSMPSTPQLRKCYLRILGVSYLASIPTHLSHLQSSLFTHRFVQLLSIHSFHSSFALTSLLSLHLTPTASLAHCSGLVNVDYCQMRDKLLAHYCKAQLYLDKIAVAAFTESIQLHLLCFWLWREGHRLVSKRLYEHTNNRDRCSKISITKIRAVSSILVHIRVSKASV